MDRNPEKRPGDPGYGTQPATPSSLSANDTSMRAVPESETLAREIKDGNLSGFVGHGTRITGETSFRGLMRIDGHVGGKLTSNAGTIIIGDGGRVDADLEVSIAIIRGTVNGNIIASKSIELGRTARVTGNIHTASLSIDQGAHFEGSCRMTGVAKQAEKSRQSESESSAEMPDYNAIAASLNAAVGDDLDISKTAGTDAAN